MRMSSRSSLAPARLRTTIRSGSSSITVGGVIQLLGLNPPWSAWTITDPSLLTMISRSASGRTAERRPEYRTSQRATMRRMKRVNLRPRADDLGPNQWTRTVAEEAIESIAILLANVSSIRAYSVRCRMRRARCMGETA